ncbi:hypothetical protein MAHJHV59_47110 [Mycobacterium avium subsp. hominissuis]
MPAGRGIIAIMPDLTRRAVLRMGAGASLGAHPEHRPACEVRHDRNNAAPGGHNPPSHAVLQALCDLA